MVEIGIYLIRCSVTGKVYVGRSKRLRARWQEHRRDLTSGRHSNPYLQAAWGKHGAEAFSFQVLKACSLDESGPLEKTYIEHYKSADRSFGYNLELVVDGVFTHSPETREKMSVSHTGKKQSPETVAKMGVYNRLNGQKGKGIPKTKTAKANISAALMGRSLSPEHRANISAARRGKELSPAALTQARKSLAQIHQDRRGRPLSPETKAKISAANKGRVLTPEEREQRSKALKGRPKTPEQIAAVVEGKRRKRLERLEQGGLNA